MKKIHTGLAMKKFSDDIPEGVVQVEVCKKSGFLATSNCRYSGTAYMEYFVAGTEPVGTCPYHSSLKVCTETGLVANDRCPNVRYVYGRGEYVGNSSLWVTSSGYSKPTNIPLKTCTLH